MLSTNHHLSLTSNFFKGGPVHGHLASSEEFDYPPVASGGNYGPNHNRNEYSISQFNDNEAAMSSWGLGSGSNYHETGVLDAKDQPVYYGDKNNVVSSI